ncbi:MAG: hypothetical protein ACFFER_01145 [Candidatus Thorarchaeota archaeon]
MTDGCPCKRVCSDCPYEEMCGGCLGEACIHVREVRSGVDRSKAKCQFGKMHGLDKTCPVENPPPPSDFPCASPKMLDSAIWNFNNDRDEMTKQPPEPDWPLLIPEVSDITDTTSRLQPWPDEGDWEIPQFDPIAWDMTGYLFDKVQGAPWVREPETLREEDWHFILGSKKNWIENLILVDRLPDRIAIQTPPTASMVVHLNRLWSFHHKLLSDEDAPRPWLLTHGYPSYIDWPPAWHWNLGIRMLCSLAEYLLAQGMGFMGPGPDVWYPDKSRKTVTDLRLPFVTTSDGNRLLWTPGVSSPGPTEVDWDYFPGIIPFVPGADTKQLHWFAERIVQMGFRNMALDAMNTIAHENFKGIPEAISALKTAGANHVFVYGPWPLHIPTKFAPTDNVSYIASASHMDLTNRPVRYWLDRNESDNGEKRKWKRLPSYRRANLGEVSLIDGVHICSCGACQFGKQKEIDPRSIWRWGHLLDAGYRWMSKKHRRRKDETTEFSRLWYQGPSYTVFRKCLHYPPEANWKGIEGILDTVTIDEIKLRVVFADDTETPAEGIHWTWWDEMYEWSDGFPKLGD